MGPAEWSLLVTALLTGIGALIQTSRASRRQEQADAYSRLDSVVTLLTGEVKQCNEARTELQAEIQRIDIEHKEADRVAWQEMNRLQQKNMRLEADNRDLKQKVMVNALKIDNVEAKVGEVIETVKNTKTTDLHTENK